MPVESANFITQLDVTSPRGNDQRSTLDNQARLIKKAVRNTLPNCNSTVSATPQNLNNLSGVTANVQAQINAAVDQVRSTSARLTADIASVSAVMNAQFLGVSATAVAAVLWNGGTRYIQTATPVTSPGDIWFQPE